MKASCIFIFFGGVAVFLRVCFWVGCHREVTERAAGLHINEEGQRVESANKVKVFSLLFLGFSSSSPPLPPPSSSSSSADTRSGGRECGRRPWRPCVRGERDRPPARQVRLPCKVKRRDARVKATAWPHVGDPSHPLTVLGGSGFPGRCGLEKSSAVDYLSVVSVRAPSLPLWFNV